MAYLNDLTGRRFGHITVLRRGEDKIHPNGSKSRRWWCICDCNPDKEFLAYGRLLSKGQQTTCPECAHKRGGQSIKTYNKYDLSGEYGIGYTADNHQFLFDKEDYELIKNYKWWINNTGYLMTTVTLNPGEHGKNILFHRLVMGVLDNPDVVIDHIKHNILDNRKSELRICSQKENTRNLKVSCVNTSGVTGVYYIKHTKKWNAYLEINHQRINLGYYNNFDDAVKARKNAEEKYFGEYSYDNSINS